MRQRKGQTLRVLIAATTALLFSQTLSVAEQGVRHHKRVRSDAGLGAATGPGGTRAGFVPPYFPGFGYGYDPAFTGTNSPYDNPYTSRSSGCCHGRN